MKAQYTIVSLVAIFTALAPLYGKDVPTIPATTVSMIVTAAVDDGKRMPELQKEDIFVKRGKERLPVMEFAPARGENAGLDLFIVIDDATVTGLGSHLEDLRKFVKAQPESTLVGIAYGRNAVAMIAQDLTNDHDKAARAIRLPMGSAGAYGSPYLSVADLMKRWPESTNRRQEVLLVGDGIDRARRERNALLNPDVDYAGSVAQRRGTIIHTIYFPGIGHWHRNHFDAFNGLNALAKLSDASGGESYSLGVESPVSLVPYLESLQNVLDNQYVLSFVAKPGKKAGMQYISISTEVAGVDISSADAVWIPAAK
ncbi:MAG TPA: hypothetical protein VGL82_04450 [Bryobacteraceae bacterium]